MELRMTSSQTGIPGGIDRTWIGGPEDTQATNDGQDSTSLQVADAGYFFDGYGIVEADLIQIEGQSVAATIAAVDYATNTITLAEPLSWTAGDGVSLPYHGALPDQGIYEHRD